MGESIAAVTGSAVALEGVACQAGVHVESGYAGMRSVFEKRQRDVSSGQLIVAAVTVIGRVAGGAGDPIERGVPAVDIVPPPRRVRGGPRHLVTGYAALAGGGVGRDAAVAGETFGVRQGSLFLMLDAEALVVGRRAHVAVVTGGNRSVDTVDMAQTAVRHLKLRA